ncbi:hypothetical protein [Streptomyces sp. NPDC018693]|uniref:hypothetical protein n=1 Tax=unclassified Streptomyces TaxID=2593676 RepID=UPI0037BC5120
MKVPAAAEDGSEDRLATIRTAARSLRDRLPAQPGGIAPRAPGIRARRSTDPLPYGPHEDRMTEPTAPALDDQVHVFSDTPGPSPSYGLVHPDGTTEQPE